MCKQCMVVSAMHAAVCNVRGYSVLVSTAALCLLTRTRIRKTFSNLPVTLIAWLCIDFSDLHGLHCYYINLIMELIAMDTSKIAKSLNQLDRKSGSLSDIADEISYLGVDYISSQVLAGCLRDAGWTYKSTGKMRVWIAPGLTAESAGVSIPANVRYRVAVAVGRLIAGMDKVYVADLHRQIKSEFGDRLNLDIANKQMDLRIARGEFGRSRDDKGPHWVRRASVATANDKPI